MVDQNYHIKTAARQIKGRDQLINASIYDTLVSKQCGILVIHVSAKEGGRLQGVLNNNSFEDFALAKREYSVFKKKRYLFVRVIREVIAS